MLWHLTFIVTRKIFQLQFNNFDLILELVDHLTNLLSIKIVQSQAL